MKKTIISLLIAGKLAMMSTATIAGAANKIDSSIDVESFKTELESAKGSKGTISASMSLEQKEKALGILGTSSIKTEDGKTIKFAFNGSFDSFNNVNNDNYPQYNPGTEESEKVKEAFAKAKSGEGVVKGECTFVKDGKSIVFKGQFIEANGLWYKFTPQATADFDGKSTPSTVASDSTETTFKTKPDPRYVAPGKKVIKVPSSDPRLRHDDRYATYKVVDREVGDDEKDHRINKNKYNVVKDK